MTQYVIVILLFIIWGSNTRTPVSVTVACKKFVVSFFTERGCGRIWLTAVKLYGVENCVKLQWKLVNLPVQHKSILWCLYVCSVSKPSSVLRNEVLFMYFFVNTGFQWSCCQAKFSLCQCKCFTANAQTYMKQYCSTNQAKRYTLLPVYQRADTYG